MVATRRRNVLAGPSATPGNATEKLALGLFSFNIHWSPGNSGASHRYCQQAVLPFLDLLESDPGMRASVAASGWELEFLAEEYPGACGMLRDLAAKDRLELLSCVYVPGSWWAFPKADMARTFDDNARALERIGIRPSPILFLPDGHFGGGMSAFAGRFEFALCNEKHIRRLWGKAMRQPFYRLQGLPVVFGCNSIWEEVGRTQRGPGLAAAPRALPFFQAQTLLDDATLGPAPPPELVQGSVSGLAWHWYHFGGVHRLCSRHPPHAWDGFFFDSAWATRCWQAIVEMRHEGFQPGFIRDYWRALERCGGAGDLPVLPESPLNVPDDADQQPSRPLRQGVQAAALSLSWRTREKLRCCAAMAEQALDTRAGETALRLEVAWRHHQFSLATPTREVAAVTSDYMQFVRANADEASRLAEALERELRATRRRGGPGTWRIAASRWEDAAPCARVEVIGADADVLWGALDEHTRVCLVRLRVEEEECGVRFGADTAAASYCPTGRERALQGVAVEECGTDELVLPLANGLIGIGGDRYLIRHNPTTMIPATISKGQPWIWFAGPGHTVGRVLEWCFVLAMGPGAEAVALANGLNGADDEAAPLDPTLRRLCERVRECSQ